MSRELSEYDWQIFKKLCPELQEGKKYRSILPPYPNFYSDLKEDFVRRIDLLSDTELDYLIGLVESGDEGRCLVPDYSRCS